MTDQSPDGIEIEREMTIRLDAHNRSEPDLLASPLPFDANRTWYAPADVLLVIEVVSPESAHRDRTVKLRKYAEAGIRHYWCIEEEDLAPVAHVYELDNPTGKYAPAGIFRHLLKLAAPFDISIDLDALVPSASR